MKIVFFGTPHFAAHILRDLLDHNIEIAAVITQPDRPKGRSLQLTPSAVKALLLEKAPQIPLYQPEKASDPAFLEILADLNADLYVVVAYGQILSQKLLDIPPKGCINIHASLLPKYRGAAPIQRAILGGETETGIAIQKMVRQLDAGDVIAIAKTPIPQEMTCQELEQTLNNLAKPLLRAVLNQYEASIPAATPQDPTMVSYAAKIEPEEGQIDWSLPASHIHNLIRAFSPRPGAWTLTTDGKRVKILRSEVLSKKGLPGMLLDDAAVACGEGAIHLLEVQPEGKKAMPASDWLRGQKNISFVSK